MIEDYNSAYQQPTFWSWVFLIYFFGVIATCLYAIVTMDDLSFSKGKKFNWSSMLMVIFLSAFSWFGFTALIKFDTKHPTNDKRL
ncbi:MAG: hypothetical protein JXB49_14245 [Bacteroidales bacterium]|nr:hypothetical protein [Bacteroidales bacterium]